VFYEGPEMPARFDELSTAFANENPHATRLDWVMFANEHSAECYRSGWLRGFEYAERDPHGPATEPETIADLLTPEWRDNAHDWEWQPELPLMFDPNAQVVDAGDSEDSPDRIAEHLARLESRNRT